MEKARKNEGKSWYLLEGFDGDKMVAIIMLLLILISLVAISSSTSLLALQNNTSRISIIGGQIVTVLAGLALAALIYIFGCRKLFIFFSQFGLWGSIGLLILLDMHINTPVISAVKMNGAYRTIKIFGISLQVFEFVKIGMIMYIAWAVATFRKGGFALANALSKSGGLSFLAKPFWQKVMYIYLPILVVTFLVSKGSNSSAVIIGGILILTAVIGGIRLTKLEVLGGIGLVVIFAGLFFTGNLGRSETGKSRIDTFGADIESQLVATLEKYGASSKEFTDLLDKNRQQISAKIAVSEGGLFGKGPGNSTQRYIVPVMFEDYMYSFIIEEYGILGGIFTLILYISLLARGAIIVRNCDDDYPKLIVGGLVMLIVFQAMLHILVNVDLMPMTGQTLPMVSHGRSSFLAFSMAFGIILSISKEARKKIDREILAAAPIGGRKEEDGNDPV